ncbi:glmZ(sRNA)-inactivating NTPase [Candidatus Desulfofervidus auxilii]|uniref:GlmZ(SRNA)-inactivating NTPase n=1 Tax=Desulfofervidus auxilii TaxID=1621989 RepID=A0A7U4QMU0_DESA2|nr:RNase adapter RapZ [Candidatus Desulfofervidus auxilii]AMM42247.1 glmZ(sRNA)-inactivating NTPase [Candidatus Desulfofervidus auxilii]
MSLSKLIVVTGTSGSGKTTALKTFEDLGFFCVDNLPPSLLPKFLELAQNSQAEKIALGIDIREREFTSQGEPIFQNIFQLGSNVDILFLDAQDEVLIRRFKETRRKHPLTQKGKGLKESIGEERVYLEEIRKTATQIIDTTFFNVHDLKRWIEARYAQNALRHINIHVISFSFKFGIPLEADLVFDVRFLPNPYFVSELKELNGRHNQVKIFMEKSKELKIFMEKLLDLLRFLMPLYKQEGKHYLNIAIGCTGGKHRSVFVAEKLIETLKQEFNKEFYISLLHRDIERK